VNDAVEERRWLQEILPRWRWDRYEFGRGNLSVWWDDVLCIIDLKTEFKTVAYPLIVVGGVDVFGQPIPVRAAVASARDVRALDADHFRFTYARIATHRDFQRTLLRDLVRLRKTIEFQIGGKGVGALARPARPTSESA
jgi:hypothetical protein